jgi:hypothetical protein
MDEDFKKPYAVSDPTDFETVDSSDNETDISKIDTDFEKENNNSQD